MMNLDLESHRTQAIRFAQAFAARPNPDMPLDEWLARNARFHTEAEREQLAAFIQSYLRHPGQPA